MKTVFMVLGIIFAYFGVSIFTYMLLTKIDPYNPDDDPYDDGDTNKPLSFFWFITLPGLLVCGVCSIISRIYDSVRKDMVGK